MLDRSLLEVKDLDGLSFWTRPGTLDINIVSENIQGDCYRLKTLKERGILLEFVVDIGAHIGGFAASVKALWPEATIVCFEPLPDNFELLVENTKAFSNVFCIPKAVTGKPQGMLRFRNYQDWGKLAGAWNTGAGQIAPDGDLEVPSCSWDDVVATARVFRQGVGVHGGAIDYLKLDCEGAEVDIATAGFESDTLKQIGRIVGESHNGETTQEILQQFLSSSHRLEMRMDAIPGPSGVGWFTGVHYSIDE